MSHRLITDLQTRVDRWFDTMMGDEARLRSYQRDLLAMRQLSLAHAAQSPHPAPVCRSQKDGEACPPCAASAGTTSKSCRVPITNEPSEQHRASRRGWPS